MEKIKIFKISKITKLNDILNDAQKKYPNKESLCRDGKSHKWFLDLGSKVNDIRYVNISCKKCNTNLAIALGLFAGSQDHC